MGEDNMGEDNMDYCFDRRRVIMAGSAAALLALPGCASLPGVSLTEAIRRLLTLSSQTAFASLLQPGGFYDSQVARIDLPPQLGGAGGGNLLSAVLSSAAFRDSLQRQVNRAAEKGAERAAPLVAETVRSISITDAAALVRGGPRAATTYLRERMGGALIEAMLPGIGDGLRLFDDGVISRALSLASGIDIRGLASDLSRRADTAIWNAIGAEEANIRANPRVTRDPLLIGVFGTGIL